MKILFSVTYYSPYVSGLTIYVKRLAEELAKRGHDATVLCMRHDENLAQEEVINGVKVIRANPLFKISKGFISIDWLFKSWQETRDAGVVIVNLPQAEGWIPAFLSKRVIAVYHCEIVLKNKLTQLILEGANWLSLARADTIVTYTEDYGKNSRLLRGFENKTAYIYPPVPMSRGKLNIQKPRGEIWIGVAARLAEEKGIEYLIEALPLLKLKTQNSKVKIVVAGPMELVGEEEYKNKILRLVEKYKDRVMFLGTIEPEKMEGFYKLIDVLVLPSVNSTEAFGMVQVEAMMCGVPVVASDLPGVRVPIQKTGVGKLVSPCDPRALAEAIMETLEKRGKLNKLSNIAKREFNYRSVLEKWKRILE